MLVDKNVMLDPVSKRAVAFLSFILTFVAGNYEVVDEDIQLDECEGGFLLGRLSVVGF